MNLHTMDTLEPHALEGHHGGCPNARVGGWVTRVERTEPELHYADENVLYEVDAPEKPWCYEQSLLFAIKKELV